MLLDLSVVSVLKFQLFSDIHYLHSFCFSFMDSHLVFKHDVNGEETLFITSTLFPSFISTLFLSHFVKLVRRSLN